MGREKWPSPVGFLFFHTNEAGACLPACEGVGESAGDRDKGREVET